MSPGCCETASQLVDADAPEERADEGRIRVGFVPRLWALLLLSAVGGGVAWSQALLAGFLKARRLPRQLA